MKKHKPSLPIRPVTRKSIPAKAGWRERTAQRVRDAVEFRKAGASFRAIGKQLGISAMQAHRDVMGALRETLDQTATTVNELRQLELERCDELLLFIWPNCRTGDCEAIRAAVRIGERRARLLGLDAVTASKLELAGALTVQRVPDEHQLSALTDEQLQDRLAKLLLVVQQTDTRSPLPSTADAHRPAPGPALTPEAEAYRQALLARQAAGNGDR